MGIVSRVFCSQDCTISFNEIRLALKDVNL